MSQRPFNFSAGPATLPMQVFERASEAVIALRRNGHARDAVSTNLSILEHSHRGKPYDEVHKAAEALAYEVLRVDPATHQVLFVQGGASMHFAIAPMNVLPAAGAPKARRTMAYTDTGWWAHKAIEEARRLGEVDVVASSAADKHDHIPALPERARWENAALVHITSNNTIFGTEWQSLPDTGDVPLIVDMSSNIGSRPIDMSRVGIAYAGAQKNLGPSGLVVVIVRRDLLARDLDPRMPAIFQYRTHASPESSLYHTPNTFGVLVLKLVLEWMKELGGLDAIETRNRRKADKLYAALDSSALFAAHAKPGHRSLMNVAFTCGRAPEAEREALTSRFLAFTSERGLVDLKGHRSIGGFRASIYNAFPEAGIDALIEAMHDFERSA